MLEPLSAQVRTGKVKVSEIMQLELPSRKVLIGACLANPAKQSDEENR
jgi:hypothetical protein